MIKKIALSGLGIIMLASPALASADVLADLLAQLQVLTAQVNALKAQANTGSVSTSASACVTLTTSLSIEDTDADTNGEVTKLQQFLAQDVSMYPEGRVTGYFGPATQRAVQRWQASHGIVSSGDPDSTGYGFVGSRTRAAMGCGATNPSVNTNTNNGSNATGLATSGSNAKSNLVPDTLRITSPASAVSIGVGQKITVSYSVGGNVIAQDPAIIERKIVKAGTDTSVSGYIPVSISGGSHAFDWTPNEAGTYQALLTITHNNTTYSARSATITVGSGNTTSSTSSSAPSVTFSHISSGNVIGSFANLPSNSQIRFVNASTDQRYDAQSTMVWSGGSGPLSITVPTGLPSGTYYLRATDYYNPSVSIAQSASFQTGSDIQTTSVAINSFSASPSSVNTGSAVLFMWSSNLTQNDVSYYGGGCRIEGLTQDNRALYVTSGSSGASGQVTFVPPATATYTLRCSSGAKDGSPMATRQVTVNVAQQQTNPVVINSFSASQTSATSGQPVTFAWDSNLTGNDISYHGGGCGISALTSYNQQIHLTSGASSGASGSVTYTPALTATYTLTCSAGAKDGSPMATKQIMVAVQ